MNRDPRYPKATKTIKRTVIDGVVSYEASHGDMRGFFSDRMDQCFACNSDYPMSDITYWRGRAYCPVCKSDIPRLLRAERDRMLVAAGHEGEVDYSSIVI